MVECPYCGDDKKPRGLKNHVRMAGGEHGEAGSVPDDFDDRLRADDGDESDENDESGASDDSDDVTTVTPDELREVHDADESGESDDESDGDDGLPFDPDDPDAIELDGGEVVDIRKDGEVYPGVKAEKGDYLLKTDKGPVLYDHNDDELYEVLTV